MDLGATFGVVDHVLGDRWGLVQLGLSPLGRIGAVELPEDLLLLLGGEIDFGHGVW